MLFLNSLFPFVSILKPSI